MILAYFDQHETKHVCRLWDLPSCACFCVQDFYLSQQNGRELQKRQVRLRLDGVLKKMMHKKLPEEIKLIYDFSPFSVGYYCCNECAIWIPGLTHKPHCVSDWFFEAESMFCPSMHSLNRQ